MSSTGLNGPFNLDFSTIEDEVVEGSPGAFALGFIDHMNRFCLTYVGSGGCADAFSNGFTTQPTA